MRYQVKPSGREREVEKYLRQEVMELGGLCPKFVSPAEAGWPDRIIILYEHTVFVETKSMRGKLSKIQEHRHEAIKKAGGSVFVLNTKDQVDEFIHGLHR